MTSLLAAPATGDATNVLFVYPRVDLVCPGTLIAAPPTGMTAPDEPFAAFEPPPPWNHPKNPWPPELCEPPLDVAIPDPPPCELPCPPPELPEAWPPPPPWLPPPWLPPPWLWANAEWPAEGSNAGTAAAKHKATAQTTMALAIGETDFGTDGRFIGPSQQTLEHLLLVYETRPARARLQLEKMMIIGSDRAEADG